MYNMVFIEHMHHHKPHVTWSIAEIGIKMWNNKKRPFCQTLMYYNALVGWRIYESMHWVTINSDNGLFLPRSFGVNFIEIRIKKNTKLFIQYHEFENFIC